MGGRDVCPDFVTLRDLAAGRLSGAEIEPVRRHLERCPRCQTTMSALEPTERAPVPAGDQATIPLDPDATIPLVGRERVCSEPPTVSEAIPDLSFLAPSSQANSLGRLAHYEVQGVLGSGGMGLVLKAFDPKLHRVVAIKVLLSRLAHSERAKRRFLREARSAAAINHVNVVTIHAVDEYMGLPYLVMECILGQSLRQRIDSGRKLEQHEFLSIAYQVARGLEAAHRQGVIHRDIKPANIMLQDGVSRVKITDFGLALVALDVTELTSIEQAVGTPAYMSPEQVRGDDVDARSDLFSFGCVLYAMAAGHSPFQGRHFLDISRRVTDLEPPTLESLDTSVSPSISELVHKLLRKAPDDRPQTAAAVAEEIRRHLAAANLGEIPVGTATVTGRPARPRRAKPIVLGLSAATALVLVVLAASPMFRPWRSSDPKVVTAPSGPPPTPAGEVIVVGSGAGSNYRTLSQALSFVSRPHTTIRLVEPGLYHASVRIEEPDRFRGLTIVGRQGVVITGPGRLNDVVKLGDVAAVTLRDLTIRSGAEQFAVEVAGSVPGLTFENVAFEKVDEDPGPSYWSHAWVAPGAHGTTTAPIRFTRCRFGPWPTGLVLQGDDNKVVAHIVIEDCRFEPQLRQLELIRAVRDVRVVGSVFQGARHAIWLDSLAGDLSRDITMANNTFFRTSSWLAPNQSGSDVGGVVVVNNALIDTGAIDPDGRLAALAAGGWRIERNLHEALGADSKIGSYHKRLDVLSRSPSDPEFLRPPAKSALATSGLGNNWPSYVGAFPSATEASRSVGDPTALSQEPKK
jgi:serine/threonine protein kinase